MRVPQVYSCRILQSHFCASPNWMCSEHCTGNHCTRTQKKSDLNLITIELTHQQTLYGILYILIAYGCIRYCGVVLMWFSQITARTPTISQTTLSHSKSRSKHTGAPPHPHTQIEEVCLFVLSLRRWSMEQKFTWRHQGESHYLDQWPWPCSFSLWTQTHTQAQSPHTSVCIGNLLRLKQSPKNI